jgi:hypothetical protein
MPSISWERERLSQPLKAIFYVRNNRRPVKYKPLKLKVMNRLLIALNCAVPNASDLFCKALMVALADLKVRLQARYEPRFPGEGSRIRKAIEQAEIEAWSTSFPHLFLPDLAEEAIARLDISPSLEVGDESTSFATIA